MVTVATTIQGPVKFLFPKYIPIALDAPVKDFSCLGLGDIAIPGFYISFLYRYDLHRSHKSIEEFSQKQAYYFNTAMIFYILSIIATNLALYFTHHAQVWFSLSLRFVARSALHCPCPPSLHLPGRRDSGRYQEHLRVQRRKTRWEIQIWLDFLFRSFKHNNRSK